MPATSYAHVKTTSFDEEIDSEISGTDWERNEDAGRYKGIGGLIAICLIAVAGGVGYVCLMHSGKANGMTNADHVSKKDAVWGPLAPANWDGTMATTLPCTDKETCLSIIDAYFQQQPRQTSSDSIGLLQAYGANSQGGGPCGADCTLDAQCPGFQQENSCSYDVYDNALAAIYLAKRGNYPEAKRILDAFWALLYPGKRMPNAYKATPSGQWITLLASRYAKTPASAGQYMGKKNVLDGGVDTGNNAWVALAFAHYAAATKQACYALPAYDILAVLKDIGTCTDDLKGFLAKFAPYPATYRSTEHNIDMYALAKILGDSEAMTQAGNFVNKMYGFFPAGNWPADGYSTGTDGNPAKPCDTNPGTGPVPVDTQFWNLLADADNIQSRKSASMAYSLRPHEEGGMKFSDNDLIGNAFGLGLNDTYHGVAFSNWAVGAQFENTASSAMAMIHYMNMAGDQPGAVPMSQDINEMRDSLILLLQRYGSILASVRGGNEKAFEMNHPDAPYPGGSTTGATSSYYRYPHTAATAWTGLLLLMQFSDSDAVTEDANPYHSPALPVPTLDAALKEWSGESQCPAAAAVAAPDPNSRLCSAHPACAGLDGDCCPTSPSQWGPGGDMLGCCTE